MARQYFTHKGVLFPCLDYSPEALSYVENEFQVRDNDVFNVTYPNSGTNWMLEILSLIHCDGDPDWVRSVLNWERAPWVNNQIGLKAALKYPTPRLICSHLPVQLFPKSLQRSKAKIIYTLRCHKDILVSLYHFSKLLLVLKDPGSLDSFLEDFLSGNGICGDWRNHLSAVQSQRFDTVYRERMQGLGMTFPGTDGPAPAPSGPAIHRPCATHMLIVLWERAPEAASLGWGV
ncbi:LOW QUALITY PROTEIN: sulfotransferase 2B1-like [Dermochelys coriacea]|uniref:LOW QUALITY PROTEIN: sulfotransferase 2B1-like n=1 Tax=Dermochelys coriacea TaxID=27794 RepID=UPI001CA7D40C|nr:LOW QUALITY PROTEIN: sulfotransferase 2B1-like [Dermochelys coriacea]